VASVQPGFEFATGSIPFYFCMGFALGFMRWWGVLREIKENHPRESAAHPW